MKLGKQGISKPRNHTFEHSVATIPEKLQSKNLLQLPKKLIIIKLIHMAYKFT